MFIDKLNTENINEKDCIDLTLEENSNLPNFQIRSSKIDNLFSLYNETERWFTRKFVLQKNTQNKIELEVILKKEADKIIPKFIFSRIKISNAQVDSSKNIKNPSKEARVELNDIGSTNLWKVFNCLANIQEVDISNFEAHSIVKTSDVVICKGKEKDYITKLIDSGKSKEMLELISDSNLEIASTFANITIQKNRKQALEEFRKHLENKDWTEPSWDKFFQINQWIFGLGLNYKFLVTERSQPSFGGTDISGKGNRKGDFLMSSMGQINFTVLVEIKKPDTAIFANKDHRKKKVPLFTTEFYGGISQILSDTKYWEIQGSRTDENRDILDNQGIYTISPRGILIIGNLEEFKDDLHKRNMFEHHRSNYNNIEVITYDELYRRAEFIVNGNNEC
jgi:hypothetical protein